jgi:hypothetical protein
MRQLRSLASNSLIASMSINFRSDEAVRVTTDRSGPTGNVPLHENRWAGRESVACVRGNITQGDYSPAYAGGLCQLNSKFLQWNNYIPRLSRRGSS